MAAAGAVELCLTQLHDEGRSPCTCKERGLSIDFMPLRLLANTRCSAPTRTARFLDKGNLESLATKLHMVLAETAPSPHRYGKLASTQGSNQQPGDGGGGGGGVETMSDGEATAFAIMSCVVTGGSGLLGHHYLASQRRDALHTLCRAVFVDALAPQQWGRPPKEQLLGSNDRAAVAATTVMPPLLHGFCVDRFVGLLLGLAAFSGDGRQAAIEVLSACGVIGAEAGDDAAADNNGGGEGSGGEGDGGDDDDDDDDDDAAGALVDTVGGALLLSCKQSFKQSGKAKGWRRGAFAKLREPFGAVVGALDLATQGTHDAGAPAPPPEVLRVERVRSATILASQRAEESARSKLAKGIITQEEYDQISRMNDALSDSRHGGDDLGIGDPLDDRRSATHAGSAAAAPVHRHLLGLAASTLAGITELVTLLVFPGSALQSPPPLHQRQVLATALRRAGFEVMLERWRHTAGVEVKRYAKAKAAQAAAVRQAAAAAAAADRAAKAAAADAADDAAAMAELKVLMDRAMNLTAEEKARVQFLMKRRTTAASVAASADADLGSIGGAGKPASSDKSVSAPSLVHDKEKAKGGLFGGLFGSKAVPKNSGRQSPPSLRSSHEGGSDEAGDAFDIDADRSVGGRKDSAPVRLGIGSSGSFKTSRKLTLSEQADASASSGGSGGGDKPSRSRVATVFGLGSFKQASDNDGGVDGESEGAVMVGELVSSPEAWADLAQRVDHYFQLLLDDEDYMAEELEDKSVKALVDAAGRHLMTPQASFATAINVAPEISSNGALRGGLETDGLVAGGSALGSSDAPPATASRLAAGWWQSVYGASHELGPAQELGHELLDLMERCVEVFGAAAGKAEAPGFADIMLESMDRKEKLKEAGGAAGEAGEEEQAVVAKAGTGRARVTLADLMGNQGGIGGGGGKGGGSSADDEKVRELEAEIEKLHAAMEAVKLDGEKRLAAVAALMTGPAPAAAPAAASAEEVGGAPAAASSGLVQKAPSALKLKDDPLFAKYFKMLKMHLPPPAVKQKMRAEGVDPDILDMDPEGPSPNQTKGAESVPDTPPREFLSC